MMLFLRWLSSFVESNGYTSSKKLAVVCGMTALSLGVLALLLAKASWVAQHGGDCSMEVAAAAVPLCALAGAAYTVGKPTDRVEK